jgi:hypothetical protein
MRADYPAAHSMDTVWFAVDRDGHVAQFESGEAGAVPEVAYREDYDQIIDALREALPETTAIVHREGRIEPTVTPHLKYQDAPALVFLRNLEPLAAELAAGLAREVPAATGVAVKFERLPTDVARRIHEQEACLGCFPLYEDDEEFRPARHGLFSYSHLCENWISGPYGRLESPAQSITLDALPPELRKDVAAVRFSTLCFHETSVLQPVNHAPCGSWETEYLDVDFETRRPIPDGPGGDEEESEEGSDANDTPAHGEAARGSFWQRVFGWLGKK